MDADGHTSTFFLGQFRMPPPLGSCWPCCELSLQRSWQKGRGCGVLQFTGSALSSKFPFLATDAEMLGYECGAGAGSSARVLGHQRCHQRPYVQSWCRLTPVQANVSQRLMREMHGGPRTDPRASLTAGAFWRPDCPVIHQHPQQTPFRTGLTFTRQGYKPLEYDKSITPGNSDSWTLALAKDKLLCTLCHCFLTSKLGICCQA